MKKKVVMTLMMMVLAGSLIACQNTQENIEVIEFEELSETSEVSQTKASEGMGQKESTRMRYEDFLKGEEKIFFNQYMPTDYEGIRFEENKGYNLSELLAVLKTKYADIEITPQTNYSYLDCGKDGIEELAFRWNGISKEGPEISTQVYIIKDIEGKLECCYYYETWSRSDTNINCYGYVTSFGSNGASNHGYDAGYVDAKGKWNFIYYTEEEWNIDGLFWDETLSKLPEVAASRQYEGDIVLMTTRFKETLTDEDFYHMEKYYSYYVDGVEEDVYSEGIYKEIFEEAGVQTYRPEEIERMIEEKETSLGITDEIKQGDKIIWEIV